MRVSNNASAVETLRLDNAGSGAALLVNATGAGLAGNFNGTVQMTGFKLPTNAANGRVLTSDASGNGTWQAGGEEEAVGA